MGSTKGTGRAKGDTGSRATVPRASRIDGLRDSLSDRVGQASAAVFLAGLALVLAATLDIEMAGVKIPSTSDWARPLVALAGLIVAVASLYIGVRPRRNIVPQPSPPDLPVPPVEPVAPPEARPDWAQYRLMFRSDQYPLAYMPLINDWVQDGSRPKGRPWGSLTVTSVPERFQIPEAFVETKVESAYRDDPSCRLDDYHVYEDRLELLLQETFYGDYLRTGEHLDEPIRGNPEDTYRGRFAAQLGVINKPVPEALTNICGVGVMLLTSDNMIVVSKHSENSHVYPGRWSFSASGLMKWGACPNPFMEVARKTYLELDHQVDPANVTLVTLGADSRKLYFQFGFAERTSQTSDAIQARHQAALERFSHERLRDTPHELQFIPFDLDHIVQAVVDDCWEPSAEACLLTMCAEQFDPLEVLKALHARMADWPKHKMTDEWDLRASRPGDLPDMSLRYQPERLAILSRQYVDALMRFMNVDLSGRDVLEVGCGTGHLTKRLVDVAGRVTAVDLCPRMLRRNKERLGKTASRVHYPDPVFIQDYHDHHDVAISSQVLIHNVADLEFQQAVKQICNSAPEVFVFEDVTQDRRTSQATCLRPEPVLVAEFAKHRMKLVESDWHPLGDPPNVDHIAFMKFVRIAGPGPSLAVTPGRPKLPSTPPSGPS